MGREEPYLRQPRQAEASFPFRCEILRTQNDIISLNDGLSKQLEVIQLVPVLHNVALDLAADGPGDEILELAGDQECWVRCDKFKSVIALYIVEDWLATTMGSSVRVTCDQTYLSFPFLHERGLAQSSW